MPIWLIRNNHILGFTIQFAVKFIRAEIQFFFGLTFGNRGSFRGLNIVFGHYPRSPTPVHWWTTKQIERSACVHTSIGVHKLDTVVNRVVSVGRCRQPIVGCLLIRGELRGIQACGRSVGASSMLLGQDRDGRPAFYHVTSK